MFKQALCYFAVAATLLMGTLIAKGKEDFSADRHKTRGLACVACHGEAQPKTAAPAQACLTCHKSLDSVAERTKDFERNPHKNHITESNDVECTQCHQGHKADIVLCDRCHSGFKFEKKQEEAKQNPDL